MYDFSARKADARVRLLDKNGNPIRELRVHLKQNSHKFLFGCGAFDTVTLMQGGLNAEENAFLTDRMDKWLKLFNYGTLPFYWARYQKEKDGPTLTPETLKAAKWLKERGAEVKGHPLCWHTSCANWLMEFSNEEILRRQIERIHRDVGDFKGIIDMWDVINEVVIMPVFDKYDNAITRICRQYGRVSLVKEVLKAAKEANPNATLLINDFNTSMAYEVLLDALLDAGVPISVIGIQSHQHQGYWGKEKLCEVLERFSRFGLPIHFTENTLISGDIMPAHIEDLNDWKVDSWPSTPEGEARQAKEAAEMYSVLFSQPLVEAITAWNFVDGGWLKAPAGVVHADNTPKPVYNKLMELIRGEWMTDIEVMTDADGRADFSGFKGGYTAKTDGGSASFELSGKEKNEISIEIGR